MITREKILPTIHVAPDLADAARSRYEVAFHSLLVYEDGALTSRKLEVPNPEYGRFLVAVARHLLPGEWFLEGQGKGDLP